MKIWIDGEFYSKEDAKVSVFDHGLLYGDGVFEGIRVYNGKVFRLEEHIERLFCGMKALGITVTHTPSQVCKLTQEAVAENEKKDCYIRLVVTRGIGDLGVNPVSCPKACMVIIVGDIQLYPPEYYAKGISLCVSSWRRPSADTVNPRVKSLNYLNNVMARQEANHQGCQEALILNQQGLVAECSGDNIFIVKNGILMTPPLWCGALGGVTRKAVLELAEKVPVKVQEMPFTLYDVMNADECFLTGTGAELVPVRSLCGRDIPVGRPVTESLRKLYNELVLV
jgi:branched-chain amino acid aminotransferase